MIGQTVTARRPFPAAAWTFLLPGVGFLGIGLFQQSTGWILASLLPLSMGLALWLLRGSALTLHFHADALEVEERSLRLPYADLQGVQAPRRPRGPHGSTGPRSYAIWIYHEGGVLVIPSTTSVPSRDIHQFLADRLSRTGARAVNPLLIDVLDREEAQHGKERVFTYRARRHLDNRAGRRLPQAAAVAAALTGLVWILAGSVGLRDGELWIVLGTLAALIGFLLWGLFFFGSDRSSHVKKWRTSSLVISPTGLALIQGDLQGEMTWEELRGIKYGGKEQFALYTQPIRGLVLKFDGAQVAIADLYDRPLYVIHDAIQEFSQLGYHPR